MPDMSVSFPAPSPPSAGRAATVADGGGRAALVLRLSAAPAGTVLPAHRRVARAVLAEAAQLRDVALLEVPGGDLLLPGIGAAEAARLAATLDRLLAPALAPGLTELLPATAATPGGTAGLAAGFAPCHDAAARSGAGRQAPPLPTGFDAAVAALLAAPERVLRRRMLLRLRPGTPPRPAFLRLTAEAAAVAAQLPAPLAEDSDLRRHAADALAWQLLRALGTPAARRSLLGAAMPAAARVPLMLDLPAAALRAMAAQRPGGSEAPPEAGEPSLLAAIPLAEAAADPDALAGLRARLRRCGWGLAVGGGGLDAAALGLLALGLLAPGPLALAADLVVIRWTPRLADDRAAAATLRHLDPARLALEGCDERGGPAALDWGLAQGITLFGGEAIDAALAEARLAACPQAPGGGGGAACTLRDCAARAAATAAEGRAGCRNPALLAAGLPA